jgi:RNA polymerase sigma factor (sigma-70 family)
MVTLSRTAHDLVGEAVAGASRGDVEAFERIVTWHHRDMTRVCLVITGGDENLSEEAVQNAWPLAWRSFKNLRDPARLRPWLVSIAANEARQVLRQRRNQARMVESDPHDVGSDRDDPSLGVERADLGRVLRGLSTEDRVLLSLKYVAGLDSVEIGQVVNLSASGVRTRLERLLARLRVELGDV